MIKSAITGLCCLLLSIIIIRTWTLSVRSDRVAECKVTDEDFVAASPEVVGRFQQALRFRTISIDGHGGDTGELGKLISFIKTAFPTIHNSSFVKAEVVANYSLLFTIKGDNSRLTPYMIIGHTDVVPVDASLWDYPPFDAAIHHGYIYGRGTFDDKHTVMGVMEAMEHLLRNGFRPQRSFYIGFGHDEELKGLQGAATISALLQTRGVKTLEFVMDEGLSVTHQIVPGVDRPVALIGTSEKGYLSLQLKVKTKSGHTAMPSKETSISILANAISKLTRDCHPSMFGYGPEIDTFQHLASEVLCDYPVRSVYRAFVGFNPGSMKLPFRIVMSNLWLFSPVVSWILSQKETTNAVTRTVTSITIVKGGVKENVLPPEATAYVNHRIHPAQTVQEVVDYDKRLIGDDRVNVNVMLSSEPLPMSPYGDEDFGYQTIKNSIKQVWPESLQAPAVTIGNTDSIHYVPLSTNLYRFSPTITYPEDVPRFHGHNERISVKNYEQAINFYVHLIKNADLAALPPYHKHTREL